VINLDQRYGWGLAHAQVETYVVQLLRHVPADSLEAQMEQIVSYFHADHGRVAALTDQRSLEHRDAWAWIEHEIALVAKIKGLSWSRDRIVELSDLVQTVVAEIVRSLGDYRFESSLRTWLHGVTVRRLRRFHRDSSAAKRSGQIEPIDAAAEQALEWGQSEQPIMASLLAAEIARVLSSKGDKRYAHIFLMRTVGDMSSDMIGQRLGLHPSRVRALLKIARDLLRQDPGLRSWVEGLPPDHKAQ
jgi:RNA polymerase sigma factor (sigma-70 family)